MLGPAGAVTAQVSLRRHMIARHPQRPRPRSNADLVRAHMYEHHHFGCDHTHGFTVGPHDRPPGWTTGEGVVMRPKR